MISAFKGTDRDFLINLMKEEFNEGQVIIKKGSDKKLESYTRYSHLNKDKGIIEFFKDILTKDDFDALKASLFMRSEMPKMNNSVNSLKSDIRDRFGDRGANIANLCSANYFENEFIPLFNESTREQFEEYYALAVGKKARALFVHSEMGVGDIEREFNGMLAKGLRYHMANFRIHGMGKVNVDNIK